MTGAAITGWGSALPSGSLDNRELAQRVDVSEDWIFERTGILSRRIATDGETTTSLATTACRAALGRADLAPEDIDLIVVATVTPDRRLPGVAPIVQHELGAVNAGGYDLVAGCAGFVYALAQASAVVETGGTRRALVCGVDVLSRITDYSDARSCVLFGDGAGAVVLESDGERNIGPFLFGSDGGFADALCIPDGGSLIRMDGRLVYRHAVERMATAITEIAGRGGLALDDIDLVIAHQANDRIVRTIADKLALTPDQVFSNIALLGNTSSASIPLALCDAIETRGIATGDQVLVVSFGAGFLWAAGLVRWAAPSVRSGSRAEEAMAHG